MLHAAGGAGPGQVQRHRLRRPRAPARPPSSTRSPASIPDGERIITIEDSAELQLQQEPRDPAGVPPAERRGQGPDHHPRPGPQLPAHAPRPHHRRRGPRRRDPRHAPGDVDRPRRLARHRARQQRRGRPDAAPDPRRRCPRSRSPSRRCRTRSTAPSTSSSSSPGTPTAPAGSPRSPSSTRTAASSSAIATVCRFVPRPMGADRVVHGQFEHSRCPAGSPNACTWPASPLPPAFGVARPSTSSTRGRPSDDAGTLGDHHRTQTDGERAVNNRPCSPSAPPSCAACSPSRACTPTRPGRAQRQALVDRLSGERPPAHRRRPRRAASRRRPPAAPHPPRPHASQLRLAATGLDLTPGEFFVVHARRGRRPLADRGRRPGPVLRPDRRARRRLGGDAFLNWQRQKRIETVHQPTPRTGPHPGQRHPGRPGPAHGHRHGGRGAGGPGGRGTGPGRRPVAVGRSIDDALGELAERLPSRELVVLVTTLVLSNRAGGAVVDSLRNLTRPWRSARRPGARSAPCSPRSP